MSEILHDNGGRRSGIERREFNYDEHIPERRTDCDRRSGLDRRLKPRTSKYWMKNSLRKIRESLMMSKAELSRKANIAAYTITRIENGLPCRMETKRKVILALGYKISEKNKVFGD